MREWIQRADKNFGIKLYQELSPLWEKTNMNAREWLSKFTKVLNKILVKVCAIEIDLSKKYLQSAKTLG